jgi:crotonobetainyl-CoA:carnitine CoA-transferase CaiB-like acyl-CoA transferase
MTGPLHGITVIDQTQALAGPYCSMMLGDLGADVLKIERPDTGDNSRQWGPPFLGSESAYYLSINRNKRSIALDIAQPAGQRILRQLLATADIFLTNLPRLALLQRYGIDYDAIAATNPRIIYLAISGYGHTGPRAGEAGYDLAIQAEAGPMYLTGDPAGAPVRFPTPLADMTTGHFALSSILAALYTREQSGVGQFIDLGLLESQMTWLQNYAAEYFATGEDPPRRGNNHPQVVPYEPMQTADDKWLILGVASDNVWRKFCDTCGDAEMAALRDDPRFATNGMRVANRELLLPQVRAVMRRRNAAEWLEIWRTAGIPGGPIRSVAQALTDPQVAARAGVLSIEHPDLGAVRSLASPFHFSATPVTQARMHPPRHGEHGDEVLAALGYNEYEIAHLRQAGVVTGMFGGVANA